MEEYGKCLMPFLFFRRKCIGPECRGWVKTIGTPIKEKSTNTSDTQLETHKAPLGPWPSDSLENCAVVLIGIKGFASYSRLADRKTGETILEEDVRFY